MALIKLSSIGITNISGKAGGSVFARNRGGAHVRNFAVPSNPQTESQEQVRGTFGGFAANWRNLTQAQRDSWYGAVDDYQRTNVFGDQTKLTGISLYVSLNQNLVNGGQAPISAPLAPQGTPAPLGIDDLLATVTDTGDFSGAFDLVFNNLGAIPASTVVIEATPVVSTGVRNFANRFRHIENVPVAGPSPQSIRFDEAYVARFGLPAVGGKIAVRAKFLNDATGETSTYVEASVIVTETTP